MKYAAEQRTARGVTWQRWRRRDIKQRRHQAASAKKRGRRGGNGAAP